MKDCFAVFSLLMVGIPTLFYCRGIKKGTVIPVLSTWIIFGIGIFLSFVTYLASGKSVIQNPLNTFDVILTVAILWSIWEGGRHELKFSRIEIVCLVLVVAISAFWAKTCNHEVANMMLQVVMTVGYLPMFEVLVKSEKNPESFPLWIVFGLGAVSSLVAGLMNENTLTIVYSTRATVCVSLVLLLMIRLERRQKKQ